MGTQNFFIFLRYVIFCLFDLKKRKRGIFQEIFERNRHNEFCAM